ncbi:MAG: type II toxin-antitoxin system RelE/ParE family toxin [Kiritimatiellales bacterium]
MSLALHVTSNAESDLKSIYEYIAKDHSQRADAIISGLETQMLKLTQFPNSGHIPPEFDNGVQQATYREFRYKPYRIFYEIFPNKLSIVAVLDCRRNIRELIQERMIRS